MQDNLEVKQRVYASIILAVIWSASVGGLFLWNTHLSKDHVNMMARTDAITAFNKDHALRQWATFHGGIYMEAIGEISPNPYMEHIEERDVVTDSGRLLTLVNPATMLNQIMKKYAELYGVQGRLVSVEPLNPDNIADDWEARAINAFKQGVKEVSEFTAVGDQQFYRLFRPMVANENCLKCHGLQDYKIGDVLGGVGIKLPTATYSQQLQTILNGNITSHSLTWLLGIIGLVVFHVRGVSDMRKKAKARIRQDNAEISSNIKSEFMSSMSHELRTPLNAIIGFSSSMKEELFGSVGSDKNREYLNDIYLSGQHLLDLINDILDVSAIEAGAMELHEENISIPNVVNVAIRLIRPRAEIGKVAVIVSIDSEFPQIHADERRLKQILLNFLNNAVKFTPEGGEVSVNAWSNDNGSVTIAVSDTGMGMDEEEILTAMDRFGQVDRDLDRKHEGTGLGLPLAKGLVELHGGTMEIKSKKGRGTQVTVTFPKERVVKGVRLSS